MGNVSAGLPRRNSSTTKGEKYRLKECPNVFHQDEYSKQEKRLMRLYLKDFVVNTPSTKAEVDLMLHHWDQLNLFHQDSREACAGITRIVQLFDTFYEHLFELAPEIRPIFRSSIQFKGRALMNIVGGIKGLLQSEDVVEKAARIAQRHVGYGVKCEYFNALGCALLKTLKTLAPALWTPQVEHAWRVVYCHVSVLVLIHLDQELNHKIWKTITNLASPSKHKASANSTTSSRYSTSTPLENSNDSRRSRHSIPSATAKESTASSGSERCGRSRASMTTMAGTGTCIHERTLELQVGLRRSKSATQLQQKDSSEVDELPRKDASDVAVAPLAMPPPHPLAKSRSSNNIKDLAKDLSLSHEITSKQQSEPMQCPHLNANAVYSPKKRKSLRLVVPAAHADVKPSTDL